MRMRLWCAQRRPPLPPPPLPTHRPHPLSPPATAVSAQAQAETKAADGNFVPVLLPEELPKGG